MCKRPNSHAELFSLSPSIKPIFFFHKWKKNVKHSEPLQKYISALFENTLQNLCCSLQALSVSISSPFLRKGVQQSHWPLHDCGLCTFYKLYLQSIYSTATANSTHLLLPGIKQTVLYSSIFAVNSGESWQ